MYHEDVKLILFQDIKEKKRTSSGVFHKTGKRGYVGKLMTPIDFLKGYDKRKYKNIRKADEYNMYELMTYEKFNTFSDDLQKTIMTEWRNRYKTKEIREALGVHNNAFYQLLKKLDIERRPKGFRVVKNGEVKSNIDNYSVDVEDQNDVSSFESKLNYELEGVVKGRELSEILKKLGFLMDGSNQYFKVKITIENDDRESVDAE